MGHSKFTWKDLIDLNNKDKAYFSNLACLAHIDVNAFFAQAEQIRCGYSKDDPVVCVQWKSIIAISYAARKHNISRMHTIQEALKKSSDIIPIHTAVFKKGENFWQYHDGYGSWNEDPAKQLPPEEYKVSLEPYRRESRKILKIFREFCDHVEKASVDEVFLDLGRLCFRDLMFPNVEATEDDDYNIVAENPLRELFVNGDYKLDMPLPPVPEALKKLSYCGLVYNHEEAPVIQDWDDVIFALASKNTQLIRKTIQDNLGYTTSCGIARNKILCKLGSNYKKPDAQTVIRNNDILEFLDQGGFEITSFWTLGGALGRELEGLLNLPEKDTIKHIRETWPANHKQLRDYIETELDEAENKKKYPVVAGSKLEVLSDKLFSMVRGTFSTPITPKPLIQSMMSNKNLRGKSCNSLVDCISWLEVFNGELTARIVDLEQDYNKIVVPRTVSLNLRSYTGDVRRKSGPLVINNSKYLSRDLLKTCVKLMQEIHDKFAAKDPSKFYPLINLNVIISNFDILDHQKTVLDMFGNQKQVFNTKTISPKLDPVTEVEDKDEDAKKFSCEKCKVHFDNLKEYDEHKDYHAALKLSESLNGVESTSKNLSIGEKRLLFSKEKRVKKKPISKNKVNGSGNIYNFFNKK